MCLVAKDCTYALPASPLLLPPPLLLCQNVGGNGNNNNNNDNHDDDGGSSDGGGGSNKDNIDKSSCMGGCAPLFFFRLACRGASKIGIQWQIGDCWKGLFKTNQLIAFSYDKSVGFNMMLINLDYLWQYLA
jgi:hypothetical protein